MTISAESRKSHGSTAASQRKILLVNVIFEEGLVIFVRKKIQENFGLLGNILKFYSYKQRQEFENSN